MNSKKNVLVVDDDSIANFLIERVVDSTGLAKHIYKAQNGKEALSVCRKESGNGVDGMPNLILLDLNMPVMDGFEFIKAFHESEIAEKNEILIVIVSSSDNPRDMEKAKNLGIKHYLTKPITAASITSIMQKEFN
jgi:CheY-like chemotaxis protein